MVIFSRKLSAAELKRRFTSLHYWELPKQTGALAPSHVWTNCDMDPTPIEDQTWNTWMILAYWATDTINLATWQTASAILAVGLSWREAIPIMIVGTFCVAVPLVLNGAIGAKLHVPFSVIATSSFGYYLRYFCIVSRAILAMFWLGIQGANGAQCITIMLRAWAPSYNDIPNQLSQSAAITTQGMLSYFLFWIIQLPLLLIHPTKLRPLFWVKLLAAPVAAIATMGWCIKRAGGGGDIFALRATADERQYAWLWLTCMSSVAGQWSTLAVNIPDFTRYAKSARGQYIQLLAMPINIFTLCGVLGIVTTAASKVFSGDYLWNPLDIMAIWLDYGSGGRCAAFFAALAWYVAQVGTNITANSISAANDLTVLLPRWINIRRGCIVAALIGGWVLVPWKILSSAQTFLAFMSGYAVFLGPIAGIMASDYWLVKKRQIDIPSLYDPDGRYRYVGGCNWRAAVAFIVPVAPLLPGLGLSISGPQVVHINDGITNLYTLNFLFGFVTSAVLYVALNYAIPAKETLLKGMIWDLDDTIIEAQGKDDVGAEKGLATASSENIKASNATLL
ncbi:permease for cytosine/purines, uracil, thiamine, allantoin-domain-containing protein [Daldinia decipiens]|uniref:permease for cytosine/purines, uracil, thiamine, allantoin-domain-containing protein n=1 Tax=Daldinia decipiens TaxID=326647 RepID=UPI0020C3A9C2|nr:permease for cytosine/purines, uracil, thiamine, allantoin-domain-containing protein [Daldinia decipiens]KAI1652546.1 permease for cytosine/purines, uracil, thiamine, allantoin-domain-containing protein [Daldinia decipiens]